MLLINAICSKLAEKSHLINAVSSKNFDQKMKKIDEKRGKILKGFVNIEFMYVLCML